MSKKELGFIDKLKKDASTGVSRIITSLKEGLSLIVKNIFLMLKFILFSIIVSLLFGFIPQEYFVYAMGLTLLAFSFLMLLFHHELFNLPVKNKFKFVKNMIFLFLLTVLISLLFTFNVDPDPEINSSHPAKIIASSLAFILLVMFLFQCIYLVKAGAGIIVSIKSTFNFLGRFGMSAMFYILLLVFMFGMSTIPSFIAPIFILISIFLFFASFYSIFILLYVFWKNAKG